jgi:hypothetical protein
MIRQDAKRNDTEVMWMPKPARHNNEKCKQMLRTDDASWCAFNFILKLAINTTRLTGIPMSSQSATIVFKRRDFDELSVCADYK